MGIFKDILSEVVLLESEADISNINSAIESHKIVHINYKSHEQKIASGERTIYPIAYGMSANGPALRAYQPEGDTASHVPSWKLFLVAGITDWETTGGEYTSRDIPGLQIKANGNEDGQMSNVETYAFRGKSLDNTIGDDPITKGELKNADYASNFSVEPKQNGTIEEPNSIDNSDKNTHIPTGIDQNTPVAPVNQPIMKASFEDEPETPEIPDEEPEQDLNALPNEPIYQDTEDEESDDELEDEVEKVNSLMERINKLYKKGKICLR